MKWQPSATNPKISRVFGILGVLGMFKLVLLTVIALSLLDHPVDLWSLLSSGKAQAAEQKAPAGQGAPGVPAAQNATAQGQRPEIQVPSGSSLNEERLVLQRKEEELNRRDRDLKQFEEELNGRLARLKTMEAQLKKMLDDAQAIREGKYKHLITVYTNMKPKQAAQVLESLDEATAVKILAGMQGRTAGEVVTYMDPKKAAALTEALTRFQVGP